MFFKNKLFNIYFIFLASLSIICLLRQNVIIEEITLHIIKVGIITKRFNFLVMKDSIIYWIGLILLGVFVVCTPKQSFVVGGLQCEKLLNPLAIDNINPYLSWRIITNENGFRQSAYQILAATDERLLTEEKADLWNSGKVDNAESAWILYQGNELSSKQFVYWKVRIWDGNNVSDWSEVACFGVGLLNPYDWKAY